MRLDKFLKVSRVIKRRALAKEVSDDGRVKVNGRVAKAGTTLEVGDEVEIRFGRNIVTIEVLKLEEHSRKADANNMYKVLKDEKIQQEAE